MKRKTILFGTVLAAFLMFMMPVIGAVNVQEKAPTLSNEIKEKICENNDSPFESSIIAFIFMWIFLWICENILHLNLGSIFNRFIP